MTELIHSVVQLIVIVLDVSPSMMVPSDPAGNAPIHDLNRALVKLYEDLKKVSHAEVVIMHIRFADDAYVEQPFESIQTSTPPTYDTSGSATDYSAALSLARQEVSEYRAVVRSSGAEANQPWLVFISDGKPNRTANPGYEAELLSDIERDKLVFIPVAVGGADTYDALEAISPKQKPLIVGSDDVDSLSFEEFFRWLSDSVEVGRPVARPNTDEDDLD